MILLQLTAGQGPEECCLAVGLALKAIEKTCREHKVKVDIVTSTRSEQSRGFKSVLLAFDEKDTVSVKHLALQWEGSMLWVCTSPIRPKHKRKNWFFSGKMFEANQQTLDRDITYQACRASGAGGQHVNTTDSAVRATHVTTGISVRVESERSQHANKRLARALILQKLEEAKQETAEQDVNARWQQHWDLERGNAVRKFVGEGFKEVRE
ncbi:peptide chain release factor H [Enterovibrio norvegicus]|uniref:peptide chain release factor H n=1 Tax=Enterovibrio norvegicus TaxID=188144 RepID=UPI00354B1D28